MVLYLDRLYREGRAAFPDFYAYTSPKLYAVVLNILSDANESQRVMTGLYADIHSLSRDISFRPCWTDLVKMARRHALDHRLAGRPIPRDVSQNVSPEKSPDSSFDFEDVQCLDKMSEAERTILEQVLRPESSDHKSALDGLKHLAERRREEGGRS